MQEEKPATERIVTVTSIKRKGADLRVRCTVGCPSVSTYVDYEDMLWHEFREVHGAHDEVELIRKGFYGDLDNLWKELTEGEEILFEGNEVALRNRIVPSVENSPKVILRRLCRVRQWDNEYRLKVGIMQRQRGVFPEREVEEYVEKWMTLTELMQTEFERTGSYNEITEAIAKEVQEFGNNGWISRISGWLFPSFVKAR